MIWGDSWRPRLIPGKNCPIFYTFTLWKAFLHWIDVLPSRVSESDVHERMHALELRLWLSLSLQALPRGTGTSWMRQNHDLDQKQRKGLRLRLKDVSGSQRSLLDIETRKEWTPVWPLEQMTSRLWLSDRFCVEDGRAATAPHRANWLVVTRSGFPDPQGLTEEPEATPSSKLHSRCGQSASKEEWL